jgi:hypothetical protein
MILIADNKRRVLLPKTIRPGDVFECEQVGERFILERLQKPPKRRPPVAKKPLHAPALKGINLDEPAFSALRDESID